jgi:hypothetical protein
LTVFSLVLHTNDLTRNGGLFVSSFLERFLDRSDLIWQQKRMRPAASWRSKEGK